MPTAPSAPQPEIEFPAAGRWLGSSSNRRSKNAAFTRLFRYRDVPAFLIDCESMKFGSAPDPVFSERMVENGTDGLFPHPAQAPDLE